MGFYIIKVVQFFYMTFITLASMFKRQRHNVRVNDLLEHVKLNNSDKKCGCSSLICM